MNLRAKESLAYCVINIYLHWYCAAQEQPCMKQSFVLLSINNLQVSAEFPEDVIAGQLSANTQWLQ